MGMRPEPPQRPVVAFVRGSFMAQSELAPLERLRDEFEVQVVAAREVRLDTRLPVMRHRSPGTALRRIPKLRRLYADALTAMLGDPHRLVGLRRSLESAALIDVPELYTGLSDQVARLAPRSGTPFLVSVWENTPFFYAENPRARSTAELVRARAAGFIARTEQIRDSLVLEGFAPNRIAVVYFGIDTDRFTSATADPAEPRVISREPGEAVVLFAGKLHWEKGVDDLLRAVRGARELLHGKPARLRLVIVGDGKERTRLRRLTSALDLETEVTFLGRVAYDDMPAAYRAAEIVAVPSKPYREGQEQCARVITEAMASGRAVVVTACGGSPELVGDAGVIVPPADHIALARALAELAVDPSLRAQLGARARRRALERFSLDVTVPQIADIYRRCSAGRAMPAVGEAPAEPAS